MSVTLIRLVNHAEILGVITNQDDEQLFMTDPLVVHIHLRPHGHSSMFLNRWMPFSAVTEHSFKKVHITNIVPVAQEVEIYYNYFLEGIREYVDRDMKVQLTESVQDPIRPNTSNMTREEQEDFTNMMELLSNTDPGTVH